MAKNQKSDSFEVLELTAINRWLDKVMRKLSERVEAQQMKKIEKQINKL